MYVCPTIEINICSILLLSGTFPTKIQKICQLQMRFTPQPNNLETKARAFLETAVHS